MEKLTLACGRFIPPRGGDTAERVERMEAYLSRLTQELELLVREVEGTLAGLTAEGERASAVSVGGEEGSI